jgi:hypothetical protein
LNESSKRHLFPWAALGIVDGVEDRTQLLFGNILIGSFLESSEVDSPALAHRLPGLGEDILPIKALPVI